MYKPTAKDYFSGRGGMELGMLQAGVNIISIPKGLTKPINCSHLQISKQLPMKRSFDNNEFSGGVRYTILILVVIAFILSCFHFRGPDSLTASVCIQISDLY